MAVVVVVGVGFTDCCGGSGACDDAGGGMSFLGSSI